MPPLRVAVFGGGPAGLSFAHALSSRLPAATITLCEAAPSPGGWLTTSRVDGFLFEGGARGVRYRAQPGADRGTVFSLIESLGLAPVTLVAAPAAAHRYVLSGGRVTRLPSSLWGALTSPLTRHLILPALREAAVPHPDLPGSEESVAAYVSRRFTPEAVPLLDAMLSGIYAGDVWSLSASSALPLAARAEAGGGSLVRGLMRPTPPRAPPPPPPHTHRRGRAGAALQPRSARLDSGAPCPDIFLRSRPAHVQPAR